MAPENEPNATGSNAFSAQFSAQQKGRGKNKVFTGNASISMEIPGIQQTARDLAGVTDALKDLKSTLQGMSSAFTAGPVVNMLAQISRQAVVTRQDLNGLSSAVAGANRPGAGAVSRVGVAQPMAPSGGGNGGASFYNSMTQSAKAGTTTSGAGASLGATMGGVIGDVTKSAISSIPLVGGMLGGLAEFAGDMAMFPLRFARERVNKNRAAAYTMSGELTPYQWQTGADMGAMMRSIGNTIPGNMKGDVSDILGALTQGRRAGAQYGFGEGTAGTRAGNFYGAVGQFQQMTPGVGAATVAQNVGNQLSNVSGNQAAAFYTGGAFSMLAQGGGMKSASQWGEGIYNWLKNQRPGRDRGKDFNYGELLAQNFPGSNINAWFDTAGVTPQMREYWWTWALAKAKMGVSGEGAVFDKMGGQGGALSGNQAWRKAAADTVLTSNEFGLAGQMTGQYATRESSNKWFNQAMGAAVNRMIPGMTQNGPMSAIQYLPDEVEQFLWNALESAGPLAQLAGGAFGWGQMVGGAITGDVGDYGSYGGTSTAGLTPDLKKKVGRMMQANPRLQVTSGLRDKYTSAKLKKKGIGNFGTGTPFMGDVGDGGVNRHSPHSAGWAADLGPRSEYGWLQRNAHKFGLQTAAKQGEPWHVQNAGTLGDVGDIPGVGFLVGAAGAIASPASAVGSAIGSVIGAADDVLSVLKAIKSLFEGAFKAMGVIKDLGTNDKLLDMTKADKNSVVKKSSQFMSLMGLGASEGMAADQVLGYDAGFAGGLPSTINLTRTGYAPSGGSNSGVTATNSVTNAGVNSVLQKYAGNNTVQAKTVTPAIQQKMLVALRAAAAQGFTGDELIAAVSLAGRESNFNPMAHNPNAGSGDNSYGLWQINMLGAMGEARRKSLGILNNDELYNPDVNAKALRQLFDSNSEAFYAWGPYKGQAPLFGGAEDWVPAVYSVAKSEGFVGDPGMEYQAAGGGGRVTAMQFNNTFHISGGAGPTGGLDIGRMVPIMADRLEEEMKKRLAVSR